MVDSDQPRPPRPDTSERLRGLLAAHRVIAGDLCRASTLERVVAAACELTGARHGAVAVRDLDGGLVQFSQHGMDPETAARVAADFPSAAELPSPALVVPLQVGGATTAQLYLGDAPFGDFTVEDEELAATMAALATAALRTARRFDEAQRSNAWLQASGEITRGLLSNADVDVLLEVVSRAMTAARAASAALVLPTEDGRLSIVSAAGLAAEVYRGYTFSPDTSALGRAIMAGESILVPDMIELSRPGFDNSHNFGPAMTAPLNDALGTRGAVLLVRTRDEPAFDRRDAALAATFAAQVAVALRFDDARTDAEWLRVLEDRDLIAQDLNDNVMQRLFATGVGLQGLAEQSLEPQVVARLARYIADLDETIEQIRVRVSGLRDSGPNASSRARSRFPRVARPAQPPRDGMM
jgi:signal transduction histidine kinase